MRGSQHLLLFGKKTLHSLLYGNFSHYIVQYFFLFFYLAVGIQFFFYAEWSLGITEHYTSRPPAVEAFLPLSAFLALKRFIMTGLYDAVHPAGLTILLMALASAFFFRKGFCGHLCPVGTISQLIFRLSQKMRISPLNIPKWVLFLLSFPKYILLLTFVYSVFWVMSTQEIEKFLEIPFNYIADTKMLLFFYPPSFLVIMSVFALILGSVFIPLIWCRCFCPYGALLGIASFFSPIAVQREPQTCSGCQKCSKNCPSGIKIHLKERVNSPECLGCAKCLAVCPQPKCLSLRMKAPFGPNKKIWSGTTAIGALLIVYFFFIAATASNNWQSKASDLELKQYHQIFFSQKKRQ